MQNIKDKNRVLFIPPDVLEFLDIITKPADLKYNAPKADFIRNNVLEEIRRKISNANTKGAY